MTLTFVWPALLRGLLLVPPLLAIYVWMQRRPPRHPVAYPNVPALAAAMRRGGRVRRHLPPALFLLAMTAVLVALARPVAPLAVPSTKVAVMLSMDVSRSMLAQDVPPTRMEAAKTAAKEFVRALPAGLRVGLVTFSSYATLIVPPASDHAKVLDAIDILTTEFATAIGDGLLEAVWALPERVRPSDPFTAPPPPARLLPPATVVLLSDGQSNRGTLPHDAARIAREQQVKVYTIGIGTPEGTFLTLGGRSIWVRLDEETLKEMAEITGGSYSRTTSVAELRQAYRQLGRAIGWERTPTEVTNLAAAAGAAMLVGALLLSFLAVHRVA
jgi:Ca-activated chloride channel family protein